MKVMKKTRYGILLLAFVLALAVGLILTGCELDPGSDPGSNAGSNNPGTSNPGTSNPGTSNPGTSNPGTSNPGDFNPYEFRTRPNPPANVTAEAASASSIAIRWSAVPDATEYLVYRSYNSTWRHVGTTSSTSYTDTGLTPGQTYHYYLSSWNSQNDYGFNESSHSAMVQASTLGGSNTASETRTTPYEFIGKWELRKSVWNGVTYTVPYSISLLGVTEWVHSGGFEIGETYLRKYANGTLERERQAYISGNYLYYVSSGQRVSSMTYELQGPNTLVITEHTLFGTVIEYLDKVPSFSW